MYLKLLFNTIRLNFEMQRKNELTFVDTSQPDFHCKRLPYVRRLCWFSPRRCPSAGVRCPSAGVRRASPRVRCPSPGVRCPSAGVRRASPRVRCPSPGVKCPSAVNQGPPSYLLSLVVSPEGPFLPWSVLCRQASCSGP